MFLVFRMGSRRFGVFGFLFCLSSLLLAWYRKVKLADDTTNPVSRKKLKLLNLQTQMLHPHNGRGGPICRIVVCESVLKKQCAALLNARFRLA